MKLGFVCPNQTEMITFAGRAGFTCLEFLAQPDSALDARRITQADQEKLQATLASQRLQATSAVIAINPLSADPVQARESYDYWVALIKLCGQLGIEYVSGTTGQNVNMDLDGNVHLFGQVFGRLVEMAQDAGVKIAFENCPHGYPRGMNLAVTPELWERLFKELPSSTVGLEYDPSHLFWQGADYVRGVYEFAERIRLVHAKDTEILQDIKARGGFYGGGWWRYRLPGYGEINWPRFFQALREVRYDGTVLIEHEDPLFHGEREQEGLRLGKHFLEQFVF